MTRETPSFSSTYLPTTMALSSDSFSSSGRQTKNSYLTSRDWMPNYEQNHVDLDYNRMELLSSLSENNKENPSEATQPQQYPMRPNTSVPTSNTNTTGTDWKAEPYKGIDVAPSTTDNSSSNRPTGTDWAAELCKGIGAAPGSVAQLMPSLLRETSSSSFIFKASMDFDSLSTSFDEHDLKSFFPPLPSTSLDNATNTKTTSEVRSAVLALFEKNKAKELNRTQERKTQRIKHMKPKTRRHKEPIIKKYVHFTDKDVLYGRGGRSNHHPGNKAFRDQAGKIRNVYKSSEKTVKTDWAKMLVGFVHEQGGRFVKQDKKTGRWYVVTNSMAREKASQAIREHMTPEERSRR